MAFELIERTTQLASETSIEPQVIVRVEGIPVIFGAVTVETALKYGMEDKNYGDAGLFYGGVVPEPNSRDYISIDKVTTKNLTQQLLQDKGGTSSVTNFKVRLVNKNNEVSALFVPGVNIDELLAANAEVFLAFQGASFPEDAIKIISGIVSSIDYAVGAIDLRISTPEELKRQEIFLNIKTELNGAITDIDTTIALDSTDGIFESQDAVTTYVRIEDEIILVGGISGNTLTSCVRGQFSTTAAAHDNDSEVSTFYTFSSDPINGALKLMLSGGDEFYTTQTAVRINTQDAGTSIQNAIFFENIDLIDQQGVTVGDLVNLTGSGSGNDFVGRTIINIVELTNQVYIVVNGSDLTAETGSFSIEFKSRYNTLADGLGMKPFHVDVQRHVDIDDLFGTAFPDYIFYWDDTVDGKDFIDQEIYFPAGLYSLPRQGRASVGYTAPPLNTASVPTLNETNILNPDTIKVSRSTTKDFYNTVVYKFNTDPLNVEEFRSGTITLSTESTDKIKLKNKPLTVEATGLRPGGTSNSVISRFSQNTLQRYGFAAQRVNGVKLLYKTGFFLEAGDVLPFGGQSLQLIDPDTGEFANERLFEIVNISKNFISGSVTVDLLNTNFGIDANYAVVGPASKIASGATDTIIPLKQSFGTTEFENETSKWVQLVGLKVKIHSEDFSFNEDSVIQQISPNLPNTLVLSTALSVAPSEDYIIELADFDETSIESQDAAKITHGYLNPTVEVSSGASGTVFDVASTTRLLVGQTIKVHNADFTNDSDDTTIIDITGTTITVENDLGFTPANGDEVELIGFLDGTSPYRFI